MKTPINSNLPATPGWTWRQTHHDNFEVSGPPAEMRLSKYRGGNYVESLDGNRPFAFRTMMKMCWWCGTHGINPMGEGEADDSKESEASMQRERAS